MGAESELGSWFLNFSAEGASETENVVKRVGEKFKELGNQSLETLTHHIDGVKDHVSEMLNPMKMLTEMLAALGIGMGLAEMLKLGAGAEATKVHFDQLTRSTEATDNMLRELKEQFAGTSISAEQYKHVAEKLLTEGVSASDIPEKLKAIGNIAAATGESIEGMATALHRAELTGKVTSRTLMTMPAVVEELKRMYPELGENIMLAAQKGYIGINQLQSAIKNLGGENGRFGTAMASQKDTLSGQWSMAKEKMEKIFTGIGTSLIKGLDLAGAMRKINDWLEEFQANYGEKIARTIRAVGNVTGWIFGNIGKGVDWLGSVFSDLVKSVKTALGGIVDALSVGDIQGAMNVAGAWLNFAWVNAIFMLKDSWRSFDDWFLSECPGIASALNEACALMKTMWVETIGYLRKAWIDWQNSVVVETIAQRILQTGLFTANEFNKEHDEMVRINNMRNKGFDEDEISKRIAKSRGLPEGSRVALKDQSAVQKHVAAYGNTQAADMVDNMDNYNRTVNKWARANAMDQATLQANLSSDMAMSRKAAPAQKAEIDKQTSAYEQAIQDARDKRAKAIASGHDVGDDAAVRAADDAVTAAEATLEKLRNQMAANVPAAAGRKGPPKPGEPGEPPPLEAGKGQGTTAFVGLTELAGKLQQEAEKDWIAKQQLCEAKEANAHLAGIHEAVTQTHIKPGKSFGAWGEDSR